MADIVLSGYSRVWFLEGGAGPATVPDLMACAKFTDPSWGQGDVTRIECPDPENYGEFVEEAEVQGARDRVSVGVMGRYQFDRSALLDLARSRCKGEFQALLGKCPEPRDYRSGWQKIVVFPAARLTSYGLENFGAIESGENNVTNENVEISAREMYEIMRVNFSELCASTVARELVSINVCDTANCGGDCGEASDGCSNVLAVQIGTGATPGTLPSVVYTSDGYATCASDNITTMFSNETPTGSACVGAQYAVIAATSNSIHYKPTADILNGVSGGWTEATDGFSGVSPRAIFSVNAGHTWIAGDSGYIWFTDDITTGVTIQSAGSVTTQVLYDIHAYDTDYVLIGGANNALVTTANGGTVWTAVTAPTAQVGVAITTVFMKSTKVWFIGYANGGFYYTLNGGTTWTQITLPGSIVRIDDLQFPTDSVGYLAGVAGGVGKILRSTAGGAAGTWYVLSESGANIPDNDRINELAVCDGEANVVYGAGLGGNGSDGFLVKAA